jgi:hypothetical protein
VPELAIAEHPQVRSAQQCSNRVEQAHQPTRVRERVMRRFKAVASAYPREYVMHRFTSGASRWPPRSGSSPPSAASANTCVHARTCRPRRSPVSLATPSIRGCASSIARRNTAPWISPARVALLDPKLRHELRRRVFGRASATARPSERASRAGPVASSK